jgi:predicted cupin superfamily sugar epimerase
MDILEIIKKFDLQPLNREGGYFRRTYTASQIFVHRHLSSAIFYLITPNSFSALHQVKNNDEMFHFYYGDTVEMLLLDSKGAGKIVTLGNDPRQCFNPQYLIPAGTWQGTRLRPGGRFAFLGVTVTPAFRDEDFILGSREELTKQYPDFKEIIGELTH